jgi:hypothetical protein
MPRTTVRAMCMTCDVHTPSESDDEGGELAAKQVQLWKQANGWRTLQAVEGRRRQAVSICPACIKEVWELGKRLPTLEEQS